MSYNKSKNSYYQNSKSFNQNDEWKTVNSKSSNQNNEWKTVNSKQQSKNVQSYYKNTNRNNKTNTFNAKKYMQYLINDNIYDNEPAWNKITLSLLNKLNETDNAQEKSQIIGCIVKFSLHEVFINEEIIKLANSIHKNGKHEIIHIALWPCLNDIPKLCPKLIRTQNDIFKTVKCIMDNTKFSILDQNDKGETVLLSLKEATKGGYVCQETSIKIYEYLMKPSEKSISKITKEIFNKITMTNLEKFRPILCWLASLPSTKFSEEFFEKFQLTKLQDRNANTGKYREIEKISLILQDIYQHGPGNSDFDDYFRQNQWNPINIDNIKQNIASHFLNLNLDSENLYNTEIIGGVIGEFANFDTITNYCSSVHIVNHPAAVMTCAAHAYPRFNDDSLKIVLSKIYNTATGKTKYNAESILRVIGSPSQINTTESVILSNNNEELYDKINFDSFNNICEEPSIDNNELVPEILENMSYTFKTKYIKNYNQQIISDVILNKSMLSIYTEVGCKALSLLLSDLFDNGLDKNIFHSHFQNEIDNIEELCIDDNYNGCKMVKELIANLFI